MSLTPIPPPRGGFESNGDFSPTEKYVKLKVMPTPRLHSTKGTMGLEFFCSLCKTKFKSEFHLPVAKPAVVRTDHGPSIEWLEKEESIMKHAKSAVLNEWDEHLRTIHPGTEKEGPPHGRARAVSLQPETISRSMSVMAI